MQKIFQIIIFFFIVAISLNGFTFNTQAQEEIESIVIQGNPTIFALSKNLDSLTFNFDLSNVEDTFEIRNVELSVNQLNSGTSSSILKLIDSKTKYILNALIASESGLKNFSNLSDILNNRVEKNIVSFTIEIDDLDDQTIVNFENINLKIDYVYKDTIAPQIGKIETTEIDRDSALIVWETNEKVKSKIRYGKTSNYSFSTESQTEEIILSEENPDIQIFRYSSLILNLSSGVTYHYQIVLEDDNGNVSESTDFTFITKLDDNGVLGTSDSTNKLQKVKNFFGLLSNQTQKYSFKLDWEDSEDEIDGYLIYRQIGKGELTQYAKVAKDQTEFIDELINENEEYSYFVRAFRSNFVSPKSDQLTILVVEDNVSDQAQEKSLQIDVKKIVIFVAGITLTILLMGYIVYQRLRIFYKNVFTIERRKNLFRDPDFFEKHFVEADKDEN